MAKSKANPMDGDELKQLQDSVAEVFLRDVHLGRVLDTMVSHLARLNNLDYPVVVEPPAEEAPAPTAEVPAEQAPSQEGAQ